MTTTSEVIGDPAIRDDGCIAFKVRVGLEEVTITASPLGLGVSSNVPLDVVGAAMQVVESFTQSRPEEIRDCYRRAAKLRRESGKPALVDRALAAGACIELPPELRNDAAVFRVHADGVDLRVFLFRDGAILDDCDAWERVTESGRKAAIAVALDYVLAHPEEAISWGLDVVLYQDIWG